MCEWHLGFFPELLRNLVLFGLGDVAGDLASILVFFAVDVPRVHFWATVLLRRARLASVLESAILGDTFAGRTAVWI